MRLICAVNFACLSLSLYTIYKIYSLPVINKFLKGCVMLQILNIFAQLLVTHEDNNDQYSFIALLANSFVYILIFAIGLVDFKILTLFAPIDERLTPVVLQRLYYFLVIGISVTFSAGLISPVVYFFKDWQYRNDFIMISFYISILFSVVGYIYTLIFYVFFTYTLYTFKKNVPEALKIYSKMLKICYLMFLVDFLAIVAISIALLYDWMYFEFNALFTAFLGSHGFIQLQLFFCAKEMVLTRAKDKEEMEREASRVMLRDIKGVSDVFKNIGDLDTVKVS